MLPPRLLLHAEPIRRPSALRLRAGLIETDAAVRTTIGGLVVPASGSKAAGAVAEHSADVSSASRARESPGKSCPSHQGHGADGYRQTTRVGLKWHQRRESETEKGDRNQDRVRPEHTPPEPVSDGLRHAPLLDRVQRLGGALGVRARLVEAHSAIWAEVDGRFQEADANLHPDLAKSDFTPRTANEELHADNSHSKHRHCHKRHVRLCRFVCHRHPQRN